jgi:putative ABC transport system permease protein
MLAQMVGSIATLLWLLYAAVCAVLLIACVNVANLSLVRAVARSRELVVRAALGATRYRIAVALYTETFVLSLAGAALGILIGILALHAFTDIGQTTLPRWNDVHVDWRVLGYVGGTVIAFTVFSGMLPAFGQRRQLADRMRSGGRSETGGTSTRTNGAFVIAEIALAIAIVACAGLVLRSFVALTHVPIGFDSRNLYLARFALPDAKCAQLRPCADLIRRLSASVDAIPGVESSSVAFAAPFGQAYNTTYLVIPHQTKPLFKVTYDVISPAFFETFRAPMLRGRAFTDGDRAGTMPVAIVNATLARALSGGSLDVIGKHIVPQASFSGPPPILTIVGVAADMRTSYSTPPERVVYAPYLQLPGVEQFVIRTKGPIPGLGAALDSALASVDPTLARPTLVSYSDLLAQNALQSKAATMLFGALALVALFLAMCGVFAVAIYSVEGRTREFGIRTALGARTSTLLNDVLARAALQGFVGIAIGLVVAAAGTRYLSSQLFETSPLDPLTFAAVTFLIVACTLSASLIPAVRAARVDPVVALRYE